MAGAKALVLAPLLIKMLEMKKLLMPLFLCGMLFISCSKEEIPKEPVDSGTETPEEQTKNDPDLEIKDFVWKAMNNIYLYKAETPELADDYFADQTELDDYLVKWNTPEDLFYDGLVPEHDKFSWIVDDYQELENYFQGSSKSAGFDYGFAYAPNSNTKLVAYVVYVSPGGPAENAGIKRGDYITEVNGGEITVNNYRGIFNPDNLELGLSTVQNGALVRDGDPVTVTKTVFKEKPIGISKVFTVDGVKIGYMFLSTFLGEFKVDDAVMNDLFAQFKSENIDELIIDLRYNSGGYGEFSKDLASMVTGQYEGKIFTQQVWNDDWQDYLFQEDPEFLYERFDGNVSNGDPINSLNLDKVYVIETSRSYSASEMFVIGLEPYINVVHVGTNTGGKYMGSYTIYDSKGFFTKEDINKNHTYAIQPLVFKYASSNGYTDFVNGLTPDIEKEETVNNLGQLGDLNEPLLARTIEAITGVNNATAMQKKANSATVDFRKILDKDGRGYLIGTNKSIENLLNAKLNSN